jgi:hypothetical protein
MRIWTANTPEGRATRKLFEDAFRDRKPEHCYHGFPNSLGCIQCQADIEQYGVDGLGGLTLKLCQHGIPLECECDECERGAV